MIKRATTEIREVFFPNREATSQLHKLIPDSKEYRICKVFLEVPKLYYHIPVWLQKCSALDSAELSQVHFSDQELCICKEWGIYEIPSRKRIDEFRTKFKRKRISVIVEVLEVMKNTYSVVDLFGGFIEPGASDQVDVACRVSLFILLEHYDISPELKYRLNEDGKYAIVDIVYPKGMSTFSWLPQYEVGNRFYSFNVLKKEVRVEIGTIIRTYLKSK